MTGRLWARLAMFAAAIAIAFALPLAGVRVQIVDVACCCPRPDKCKCPDHEAPEGAPSMQACHRTVETFATPPIPQFDPPALAVLVVEPVVAHVVHAPLASPHAPPAPRRPDAPS